MSGLANLRIAGNQDFVPRPLDSSIYIITPAHLEEKAVCGCKAGAGDRLSDLLIHIDPYACLHVPAQSQSNTTMDTSLIFEE